MIFSFCHCPVWTCSHHKKKVKHGNNWLTRKQGITATSEGRMKYMLLPSSCWTLQTFLLHMFIVVMIWPVPAGWEFIFGGLNLQNPAPGSQLQHSIAFIIYWVFDLLLHKFHNTKSLSEVLHVFWCHLNNFCIRETRRAFRLGRDVCCFFFGYLSDHHDDTWANQTCLWGSANVSGFNARAGMHGQQNCQQMRLSYHWSHLCFVSCCQGNCQAKHEFNNSSQWGT